MHIRIRGKQWELVFEKLADGYFGFCDHPERLGKKIRIRPDQGELEMLDTLLHEMGHAAYWDMKEEAIDEAATDIAKALWRLGYRRQQE